MSDTPQQLRESVKWFNLSEELLPSDGLVLVAVSGGPDSMALLSILESLSHDLGFRVAVAHFDHKLREDSGEDRKRVEAIAKSLGLTVYTGQGDVRKRVETSGESLEEGARKARYEFLTRVADETRASRIATGHTRDDQAETVLMRILHGTGIRGLSGIPIRRGRIIRPLLCASREETRAYCDELSISYSMDPTNMDTRILRNRIRSELMPLLESSYHNGAENNLLRLADNAREMMDGIRSKTTPLIEQNLREISDHEWVLNVSSIATLDATSMVVLFGDVFGESLHCDMDFGRVHYEDVIRLVHDSRGSGKMLSLPGLTIKKEYENLILTKPMASASVLPQLDYRTTLTFPGETHVAGSVVRTEIIDVENLDQASMKATPKTALFALEGLRFPLVLRAPRTGDRMRPFGMEGTKKLSDIFADKKIPGRERARTLVVADADEIVWIVGVTTSEKSRVAPKSDKVVRISLEPEPK